MPRVTLAFNLPDEWNELWTALRAEVYVSTLWEIDQKCRSALKYGNGRFTATDLRQIRADLGDVGIYEEFTG